MALACCINMSKGSEKEPCHQQTWHFVSPKTNSGGAPSRIPQSGTPQNRALTTTASALEDAICSHLAYPDVFSNGGSGSSGDELREEGDPVQIFTNDDAHFLRCRPLPTDENGEEPAPTIFGICENVSSLGGASGGEASVRIALLEPHCDSLICNGSDRSQNNQPKGCCCHHPKGNWTRQEEVWDGTTKKYATNGDAPRSTSPYHANVKIVDLSKIQDLRRGAGTGDLYPCFDTPGKVFHLLRSALNSKSDQSATHQCGGLHSASPWNQMYYHDKNFFNSNCNDEFGGADSGTDQVVAFLVNNPNNSLINNRIHTNDHFWDDIERREADELLNFRTGDAAPSHFLHSVAQLTGRNQFLLDIINCYEGATSNEKEKTLNGSSSSQSKHLLLIYRHLSPRDVLSHHCTGIGKKREYVGCLWETYLEPAEDMEPETGSQPPTQIPPLVQYRMVSPPYQSHAQEYPGLLDALLQGVRFIREEAQKIPQWTAWPEQNHYSDASWNVFPLCYTFPAEDITQRKWVHKTCAFVPETTKLLQTLGPALRTALFSRLDPGARLGTHTGWSDLANHVLRAHIPLIVPGGKNCTNGKTYNDSDYKTGLCGTWVDGCVETHEEGRVICFDDSKVHRAFNYSDEDRIVLIVDLLRPKGLPMGTAVGGHTDELDSFINQF